MKAPGGAAAGLVPPPGPRWLPSPWSRSPQVSRAAELPPLPPSRRHSPLRFCRAPLRPARAVPCGGWARAGPLGGARRLSGRCGPALPLPTLPALLWAAEGIGAGAVPCSRRRTCRGQSGRRRARVGDGRSRRDKCLPLRLNQVAAALALRDRRSVPEAPQGGSGVWRARLWRQGRGEAAMWLARARGAPPEHVPLGWGAEPASWGGESSLGLIAFT